MLCTYQLFRVIFYLFLLESDLKSLYENDADSPIAVKMVSRSH